MAESVNIPDELFYAACCEANSNNRSVADQIARWLLIGRAAEASDSFDYDRVVDALEGRCDTTQLTDLEAAVWLDAFCEKMGHASDADEAFLAGRRRPGKGVGTEVPNAQPPAHDDNA
ncbi:TA system antitoxin ParD family protein [Actibacterium lipolyticum]|uniref:ParD-like antitoxin of type II toxin-antitoxin system n=1 Tax=Actibacterium lipolyticum TaxID=1524263 RepID=A0A238JN43_9RHOB|nr:hypothetical protein [Actibacterium lipolyticum]SMX31915.1 hypothetical protein COL8621_00648 [Actibacterium lipolyticum]